MPKSSNSKNEAEFKKPTAWGVEFSKKKGIKSEEDVVEVIDRTRNISDDEIPTMEEMFKQRDKLKQKRKYITKEIIKISHELREKR